MNKPFKRTGLLVTVFATGFATGPVLAKDTLTYASSLPQTHASSIGIQYFADQVSEKTDGEISIEFFPAGSAASAKTMLSAVSKGLIDGGFIANIYYPGELPVTTIISDLSFWNSGTKVISAAITDTVINDCPACVEEFEKNGIHFLSTYGTPPYLAMCAKADGAEDLQGKRLRVAGEDMGRWAQKIGAIPVNIPNNEAYEAMQRGQVDCIIGATAWMKSLSLGELVEGVIDLPMGAFQGGSLINVSTGYWDKLDPDRQRILSEVALGATARTVFAYLEQDVISNQIMADESIAIIAPSPGLVAAQEAFRLNQRATAVENAARRGVEDGDAVASALLVNIDKWTGILAEHPDVDEPGYRALLVAEILGAAQ